MTENQLLKSAREYLDAGYSVIPVRQDKRPLVSWAEFQNRRPDFQELNAWWAKYPNANVAIVTGSISDLNVVDIDSSNGKKEIERFLPDNLQLPMATTPRGEGWHCYFSYQDGLSNSVKLLDGCDIRTDGGYIIAPPSVGQNRKSYQWLQGLSILRLPPPAMPASLYNALKNRSNGFEGRENNLAPVLNCPHLSSDVFKAFSEGSRDNSLFRVANSLIKGGMSEEEVEITISYLAMNCKPPYPQKEIRRIVESAMKRANTRTSNLSGEVRDFVLSSNGIFTSAEIHSCLHLSSRNDKKNVSLSLSRLVDEGIIERVGLRNGHFRRIQGELEVMDFLNAKTETVDLWLPFGLHEMVETMPGNIILVSGEPNSGKTGFLLNIIRHNMHNSELHYFNSEMGSIELSKRLSNFNGLRLQDWKFKAYERSGDFADVIKAGKGKINIIDFLELHENFYEVSGKLADIHKKLKGAIAIVALQKNSGTDYGLGGQRSLEKPRLAIAMSPGKLKVVKAKNWKTNENPNGKAINFKLAAGCKLIKTGDWYKE